MPIGIILFAIFAVIFVIWFVVAWRRSGEKSSHEKFLNAEGEKPPIGRMGE